MPLHALESTVMEDLEKEVGEVARLAADTELQDTAVLKCVCVPPALSLSLAPHD